jgi:hypothetical protein
MTKLERGRYQRVPEVVLVIVWFLRWKMGRAYRATRPAVAPAAVTCRREPSSLRRSPLSDIHPVEPVECPGCRRYLVEKGC